MAVRPGRHPSKRIPLTNYLRMPTLAAGLLLVMFLPGIIKQGAPTYHAATGLTQAPYLSRWLLLTATFYLTSAIWYAVKILFAQRRSADGAATSARRPHRRPSNLPTHTPPGLHRRLASPRQSSVTKKPPRSTLATTRPSGRSRVSGHRADEGIVDQGGARK